MGWQPPVLGVWRGNEPRRDVLCRNRSTAGSWREIFPPVTWPCLREFLLSSSLVHEGMFMGKK